MSRKSPAKAPSAPPPKEESNLNAEEIEEIKEAFDLFDTDGSGTIDPDEIQDALELLNEDRRSTVYRLLRSICEEGRKLTFEEFIAYVDDKLGDKTSRQGISNIFSLFTDGETISVVDMIKISKELGEAMTREQIEKAIGKVSKNKAVISIDDFYRLLSKRAYS